MAGQNKDNKNKAAEDAIFNQAPENGAENAAKADNKIETPAKPEAKTSEDGAKVTISKSQFEAIMGRLSDLESGAMAREPKGAEDVFNPLAEVKKDHVVRLTYHGDDLVVGYVGKIRPDGKEVFTFLKEDPESRTMRTYATLLLITPEGKEKEELVDFVKFLEYSIQVDAVLKERKDIGKLVEHGLVKQAVWDGTRMAETGMRVMSGTKEQRFEYVVTHKGKDYKLPQEVINIK